MIELSEGGGASKTFSLDVVFYGVPPEPAVVDDVLRHSLEAAVAFQPDQDIAARAWLRASPSGVKRRALPLANGADGLRYVAKDQEIQDGPGGTAPPVKPVEPVDDRYSTVIANTKVVNSCQGSTAAHVDTLTGVALEKHGAERRIIVKAMREWCKANDVPVDRSMRICMSAISKAVMAIKRTPTLSPEDLAASIARGKIEYGTRGCGKCHLATGRGGPRGPDLTDDAWEHCDGSVETIGNVILTGVPQRKLKDRSRPSAMNPARNLSRGDAVLTDLATYVHSLSQK